MDAADDASSQSQKSSDFLFEVQPREIAPGDTATLRWAIKGATKVLIEESSMSERALHTIGTFGASGSLKVQPKEDTSYVLSCEGSTTFSCVSVTLRVRVKRLKKAGVPRHPVKCWRRRRRMGDTAPAAN